MVPDRSQNPTVYLFFNLSILQFQAGEQMFCVGPNAPRIRQLVLRKLG